VLAELVVADLGVIERLSLVLGPGMTAVTGETGAGKTLIVEAIELLVGGRADPMMVRPGADEATVEGRFLLGDDEVVLRRVVPRVGRSRAYVNGHLATASALAEWGRRAVDLHGQHDHQSLLAAPVQRAALDRYGGVDLDPLVGARRALASIEAHLAELGGDERERARELDLLRFQVAELDAAALRDPDEDARLDAEEQLLDDAVAHREAASLAAGALTEDGGALDAVGVALQALDGRAPFTTEAARLGAVLAELADLASEVRGRGEGIEDDPQRLAELRTRRQLLRDLRRKYGDTLADVLTFAQQAVQRLDELVARDATAARLEAERDDARAAVAEAERVVGAARRAAAPGLAAETEANLRTLAMERARLVIDVGPDPGDEVVFELAANPGAPPLPLAKVASGGELARAMLALRLVLTEAPETLVFDEVDAGIGGAAADAVGRALGALGGRHQVLVVTHLAQVAAFADHQVVVAKKVDRGRTFTTVSAVTGERRGAEVARMLSGRSSSATAREHAAELLRVAAKERSRARR
jgi:DNA repair protein RecN (Recombination protein N)